MATARHRRRSSHAIVAFPLRVSQRRGSNGRKLFEILSGRWPAREPRSSRRIVTSYNLETRDEDGLVGDPARRVTLFEHLEGLRTAPPKRRGPDRQTERGAEKEGS